MSLIEEWLKEIKEIFKIKEKQKERINKEILKKLCEKELELLKYYCKNNNNKQIYIRFSNIFLPVSCQEALRYLEGKLEEFS